MKCAMNKLCGGGGDTAKRTRGEIKTFSECKGVCLPQSKDYKSDT